MMIRNEHGHENIINFSYISDRNPPRFNRSITF
jgi:hypothetical protein